MIILLGQTCESQMGWFFSSGEVALDGSATNRAIPSNYHSLNTEVRPIYNKSNCACFTF